MRSYVDDLKASQGSERRVVWFGDAGQHGSEVFWSEAAGQWFVIELGNLDARVQRADEIAVVQLNADADPGELEALALATDFECEDGLWIVDLADLEGLSQEYRPVLRVLWRSGGPVIVAVSESGT